MKKYEVVLSNRNSIFDSRNGFDSVADAMEWASGRGGTYVIHIGSNDPNGNGLSISATCSNGKTNYKYYYIAEWQSITVAEIASMI